MIYYYFDKQQCSNSGGKWIDINPLECDLIVQPPSPLEFPGPLPHPPGIIANFFRGGVWIFSATTHSLITGGKRFKDVLVHHIFYFINFILYIER